MSETLATEEAEEAEAAVLTPAQLERRFALEARIDDGLEALYILKTEGLWRDYPSFAEYVSERWHKGTPRRANQLIAGYRVILMVTQALEGTDVPAPTNENQVRPLVTLAASDPQRAVDVYRSAVELAGGSAPGNAQVMLARQMALTPEEVEREAVAVQLRAMQRYGHLEDELKTGGKPALLLGLATVLEACENRVRLAMVRADVREIALIRLINQSFVEHREMAEEILQTGYLQFGDYGVPLTRATARDFRKLADLKWKEHIQQERDARRGEPVSIVVYGDDPEGTLESLQRVLPYTMLIRVANLIGEL